MPLSLLPAFRELRAPLTAGYILLLAGWLEYHTGLVKAEHKNKVLDALSELQRSYGKAATLAGLTLLALIIGSLIQYLAEAVGRLRNVGRGGAKYDIPDDKPLLTYLDEKIRENPALLDVYRKEPGKASVNADELKTAMLASITGELPRIARRMRGSQNELFDEYDRSIAEAQFREVTSIPLCLLIGTLSWHWSVWFLAALTAPLMLKKQANHQRREGNEVVVDALLVGKVAAPSLERLERLAAQANTP